MKDSNFTMKYATGQQITVGDEVVADGMSGTVVCDFDNREFLEGYETWDVPDVEILGGETLSSGVMIRTDEAGLIHYREHIGHIEFVGRQS